MTMSGNSDREQIQGTLTVVRPASPVEAVQFETFIKITADGSITAYNGHVDLGTGIRTALGQIVAEELDVSFARVVVVLGDTSLVPNQGATIASETIQITAVPLRKAAAQARQFWSRVPRRGWSFQSRISLLKTDWCAAGTIAASAMVN